MKIHIMRFVFVFVFALSMLSVGVMAVDEAKISDIDREALSAKADDNIRNKQALCHVYQGILESGKSSYAAMPIFCAPVEPKIVFVTRDTWTGDLDGIAGADAKCQQAADAAQPTPLHGIYKAWIATSPDTSPLVRFTQSVSPYVLVDGTIVADSWYDLTDGLIEVPINIDEDGVLVDPELVWTNIDGKGRAVVSLYQDSAWSIPWDQHGYARSCNGFTDDDSLEGWVGSTEAAIRTWTKDGDVPCSFELHLYCFQQ